MDFRNDFLLTSVSGRIVDPAVPEAQPLPDLLGENLPLTLVSGRVGANPFGPLANLPGTWLGRGFNQIWRPFNGSQDRFLEFNETIETLQFDVIPGKIPNRGLLQPDMNLVGLRYLQQIQD